MEGWMLAIALKPLGLLAFFFGIGIIACCLKYLIPDGALKEVLYDRTIQQKHPVMLTVLIIGFYVAFLTTLAITIDH